MENLSLLVYFSLAKSRYSQFCCEENQTAVWLGWENNFKHFNWTAKGDKERRQMCSMSKSCKVSHILSSSFQKMFHSVVALFLFRLAWFKHCCRPGLALRRVMNIMIWQWFWGLSKSFWWLFSPRFSSSSTWQFIGDWIFCRGPRLYCNLPQGGSEIGHHIFATFCQHRVPILQFISYPSHCCSCWAPDSMDSYKGKA